jgi:autotransporter-associated beta strand protein
VYRFPFLLAFCLLNLCPQRSKADEAQQKLNYSYLYFENGYPTLSSSRRPQSEANVAARANPDLVFQTGYYSLMLGCDDLQIKGYDGLPGTDYLTALDQDVTVFTPATSLLLEVVQGGVSYQCTHALAQGPGAECPVRLIESGQYLQRIDHLGLVFKDAQGNVLQADGESRLEISAWADRMTFFLDFSAETANPITQTTIQLVSPGGTTHLSTESGNQSRLTLKPHDDSELPPLDVNRITAATNLQDGLPLTVSHDPDVHALKIDVPANPVSYPSSSNRVDEYLIELNNPSGSAENIPLVFEQPIPRAITGTVMVLCDADSGRPLGIPVQISKNWHRKYIDADGNGSHETYVPTVHDGPWLRGSTLLALQAGETRRFKLRVIYGYWGGAGAISHSQLSLIGWGGNWMWDESALGAWGESLTYDPTQHIGSAFLDDIRPAFTDSYDGTTHNWTENVGGGDFLIYRDSANTYRWLKRQKTCYLQTGPNLTEVHYGGITDDDKIRVTYVSRAVSTLDYHRRFHEYKYEFLQNVVTPSRLIFHQMAADFYPAAAFTDYSLGDASGLLSSETIETGGNVYKGSPIPFDGKWLSIDDITGGKDPARALRGIIPISSTLNGSPLPLHIHKYGRTWGASTMLFDLSSASVTRSYSAGDVVEGEVEFIMPPQHVDNYWGGDAELINRLTGYGDTRWEPVRDEMLHNLQMNVSMHAGALLRNYPLEIQPSPSGNVLADFTIHGGGIGHIPVVLRNAASGLAVKAQRWNNGTWSDLESVDIDNHSYYQALRNVDGTTDYTFSIHRPSTDLNNAWRVRVMYDVVSVSAENLDMLLLLPETKTTGNISLSANSSMNVDLTIGISGESQPGSFSVLTGTTQTINPSLGPVATVMLQFDNAVANLAPNTFATGQVTIQWSEQRVGGASGQFVLPVSALALSSGRSGASLIWDADVGDGTSISEGTGSWQTGTGNWNNNGSDQTWTNGQQATFGGGTSGNAGIVTLNGNMVPTQLTFRPPAAGNYIIDLASFNLTTANIMNAVEVIGGTSATIKATGGGRLVTPYSGTDWNFTVTGSLVIDAPVTGPGVVFAAGAGNLNLTHHANSFTGIFGKQNGGDLAFSSITASGLASAAGAGDELRIGFNARAVYTGSGNWTNRTFNFSGASNGTLDNDGTGALIWAGPFSNTTTAGGARKFTLGGSNTGGNDFQGILSDHPSNGSVLDLEKNDPGTWILSGNNTYTGVTTVSTGILQIKNNDALGTTAGNTIVNSTGVLELGGGVTTVEPITIATGRMGAISATWGSNNRLIGAVTLTSHADFRLGPGITTFSGGITSANNSNLGLNGRAIVNTTPITIGTGQLGFTSNSNSAATEIHVAGNTWGKTLFNFGGYLRLGAAKVLPAMTDVEFGWAAQSWSSGTLDLNGFDQTVASIGIHSLSVGLGGDQNITGGGTLTVNLTSGTKTYEGRITDGAAPTSLVKMGGGMQILNNLSGTPNSYSGNTTVTGGTLSIRTATLADASMVSISPGAVLDLDFTGTDTVNALFIGTKQMAAGVYGASGINTPEISGTGTLTVTSGPVESFSSWITRNFTNGAVSVGNQEPTDDPDNDGLDNLVEYGLGKDPTVSSQPAGVRSGDLLTYTKGADAIANRDVSWVIETSETLAEGSWTPQVSQPAGDANPTISYLLTPAGPPRKFARLRLMQD